MIKKKVYKNPSNEEIKFFPKEEELNEFEVCYYLAASEGKILTNNQILIYSIIVNEWEIDQWFEIKIPKGVYSSKIAHVKENNNISDKEENDNINYKELLDIVTGNEGEVM